MFAASVPEVFACRGGGGRGDVAPGPAAHAAGSDVIEIGLIGCGGRGSGAAANAMNAGKDVRLVAMADIFADRLQGARARLKEMYPGQVEVADDHCFVGFDAYQKVIDSGVDVVLIAAASHFHPHAPEGRHRRRQARVLRKAARHRRAGAEAAMAAAEEAEEEALPRLRPVLALRPGRARGDEAGPRRRHRRHRGHPGKLHRHALHPPRAAARMERNAVPDAELVPLQLALRRPDRPAMVHSLDKASWAMGDMPPMKAWGMGGRQVCVEPKYGDQFDHHAVVFEYASGVRVFGFSRDMLGCYNETSDVIFGTKGRAILPSRPRIEGGTPGSTTVPRPACTTWSTRSVRRHPRRPTVHNGDYMFTSSMLGILAQMVCYTGQEITWEQAMGSKLSFTLPHYGWDVEAADEPGPNGQYAAAMPGLTAFRSKLSGRVKSEPDLFKLREGRRDRSLSPSEGRGK